MRPDLTSRADCKAYGIAGMRMVGVSCGHDVWIGPAPAPEIEPGRFAAMNPTPAGRRRTVRPARYQPGNLRERKNKVELLLGAGISTREIVRTLHVSGATVAAVRQRMAESAVLEALQ